MMRVAPGSCIVTPTKFDAADIDCLLWVIIMNCVFALISTHITSGNNPHVIAAGVVTGVGFLGAGVIMKDQGSIVGLTTAATLWATASVGLAIGYGMYTLGVLVSSIVFGLLAAHHIPGWAHLKANRSDGHH